MNTAASVCCNSSFTKNLVKKISYKTRCTIIHPGVHFIEDYSTSSKSYNLLSIGRLVERKGFQFVVQTIPSLKAIYHNLNYYIVGDGDYRSILSNLVVENNIEDCVHLVGRVSEEEKRNYLKNCDMLLMPSIDIPEDSSIEGFGMVYIEANMYGKYVIGTNSGGIPDAVINKETGVLINDVSIETIKNAVIDVYDKFDELYSNALIDSRIKWAEKHSLPNIAFEYKKIFDNIEQHYLQKKK